MNLEQLRKAVLQDIDEEADNIQLDSWINRGYLALSDIVKPIKKTTTNADVTLNDLVGIKMIFGNSTGDEYKSLALNDTENSGYVLIGSTMELRNIDEPVTIYYFTELQPLISPSDVPKIPVQYHDMLVHYAVAHLQFYEEAFDQRPDRMNAYNNRLADLKRYYDEKEYKTTFKRKTVHSKVVW